MSWASRLCLLRPWCSLPHQQTLLRVLSCRMWIANFVSATRLRCDIVFSGIFAFESQCACHMCVSVHEDFTAAACHCVTVSLFDLSAVIYSLWHKSPQNVDGSSSQIYLHNTEERRSKSSDKIQDEANVIPKSFRLLFSSVRSAQDIFKLILVPEVEVEGFASVQALLKPACLYAAEVADKTKTLTLEQFEDAIRWGDVLYQKSNIEISAWI